ncbi:RNA polymerase factor sigma-54 [uncultured Microscilla sp.]|uniref:RNA polymerase factor sigma-54 n=1 Tax=uncultured Microscilla sp. TaxID=432653 RepID=UPI002632E139|nr:RNA polymerase factor sigma-54 [uncultured Microscilla sp.]
MLKQNLSTSLVQKLSPQQIQFIKLLQIPTAELHTRIEEELEINPILEEGREEKEKEKDEMSNSDTSDNDDEDYDEQPEVDMEEEISIEDYLHEEEMNGYKMYGDGASREEDKEIPLPMSTTLNDSLLIQLGFLGLDERQKTIAQQLIGSIDGDGYIRRAIEAIVNDLAFSQNVETTEEEIEQILNKVQYFDPPGIAARDLQECLMIQLKRRDDDGEVSEAAMKIVENCFEEFTKKHYDKIKKKLDASDEILKKAVDTITKLNPKPGGESGSSFAQRQYIIPDFILANNNGKLELSLNSRNAPELRINQTYAEMLDTYSKSDKKDKKIKETVTFVKQKLDAAKWFIDAIKQRQQTLLRTMNAIIEYQYEFFLEGDESKFRPMILKDIADKISMDISTISRVANSKSIQTDFGIYPLKYFFSEGISTKTGEDVSSREVKHVLKELVNSENKKKPLSDDKLEKLLKEKGYKIARRTVAKYREQLGIPVARLRKKL